MVSGIDQFLFRGIALSLMFLKPEGKGPSNVKVKRFFWRQYYLEHSMKVMK